MTGQGITRTTGTVYDVPVIVCGALLSLDFTIVPDAAAPIVLVGFPSLRAHHAVIDSANSSLHFPAAPRIVMSDDYDLLAGDQLFCVTLDAFDVAQHVDDASEACRISVTAVDTREKIFRSPSSYWLEADK